MIQPLIDFLKDFIGIFQFWKVVKEYNRAAHFRLGRFRRILEPGFYFCWPLYVDTFDEVTVVMQTERFAMQDLETRDEQKVSIAVAVKFIIRHPKKFLVECCDQKDAIEDIITGWVAECIERHTWEQLRQMDFRGDLLRAVREGTRDLGLGVLAVNVPSFTRTRGIRLTGIDMAPKLLV